MRLAPLIAGCAAALGVVLAAGCGNHATALTVRPSPRAVANPPPLEYRSRSVEGRPITARELGGAASGAPVVLVVGCIHGNEHAGIAVVQRLQAVPPSAGVALWTVPDLNPDGVHADTRQNADGVDLNRNFPFRWEALGVRGDQQFAGAHALSEPESRFAYRLILRLRPRVTIWFHQPLGVVDESGGDQAIERRFARLAKLPLRRLTRYPGSAAGWQDDRLPGTTAFVVELPPGRPSSRDIGRWARAVESLASSISRSR